jgi:transposase
MLLESLVKATVELQGFRVVRVTGDVGGLVAELAPDLRYAPRCGQCGDRGGYRDTRRVRHFRHVPLWGIPVALRYAPRRVRCARCAGVHVEAMPWVSGTQQLTRALLVTLATWARALPWQQVARLFRCSWGTVATAVEAAVAYGLAHRDLNDVTHIGIDEISRKRGHVYVTNVYDLARKRLVWSGEGRSTATINAFFDGLGQEKTAALEGICCDMWQPYIDVIKARAPQAVLVFDKFHIVRHLMEAVDQVRRDEVREKGPAHKALMHKTRFIWLKNPWNLTESQALRLGTLERLNLKINRAYLLKELFRNFWEYRRAGWAKRYLKQWFWWATHSRLPPLRDFAWLVRRHEDDILNYFRIPIDNGTVEGLNNKAKLVIHKAYGFRTAKNYIRNLYHCLGNLSLPQTVHTFV